MAEAGTWWQLDSGCILQDEGPVWLCEQRGTRQVGSVFFQWDQVRRGTLMWMWMALIRMVVTLMILRMLLMILQLR